MADATGDKVSEKGVPWPSRKLAWTALAILATANILSYLDRIIINLLVEPIKSDLVITDTQFSLLQGVAFGLFYATLALPIGRMVDMRSRKPIIIIGVLVFSVSSLFSGLARSFQQMFLCRVGVGAGEASILPASYSMITDYFAPQYLGRAISIFTMTSFVGIGLAYIAGGAAIEAIAAWNAPWPLAQLEPWRRVFIVVSLPGILIVPLLLCLREPERRGVVTSKPISIKNAFGHVKTQGKVLYPIFAGFSLITMAGYAATVWTPAVFIRVYDWSAGDVGYYYGIVFLIFAPLGALIGGTLSDRLTAKGYKDAPLRVAAFGYIGAGLFGGIAPLMPNGTAALACFAPAILLTTLPYPLAGTAIQLITPNNLRGQVTALYMLVINMVGLGLGPLIVAVFSDLVFVEADGIRYSLAIVSAACAPLAFFCLLKAMPHFRKIRASETA
ncbi:spinster family MFS transporter [Parasphingorhabdus cellanae]|uniref:MFS transporter n=1 Tax=Parasphingorhabdus cellanae TaxID=2806553 RepID=A0ABX7TAM0_9SPHN|nr:MFS transporter [Parasphingorhabdus cellanae]QTD57268.1 MFS transporter [Parasphingorhabdus cellanae]